MVEMKLLVAIVVFRMLVIMKNQIICKMNIVIMRRNKWFIMIGFTEWILMHF